MNDNDNLIIRSLDRIETKTDRLQDDISNIKATQEIHSHHLADYNESLKEHMRRTQMLENRVETLELVTIQTKMERNFIKRNWKKLTMIAGILSALASAVWSIMQIMGK